MVPRVVLVGEALVDLLGEGGNTLEEARSFRPSPGGAPANAAAAAARAGAPTAFVGCVGADAFGRTVLQALGRSGVDTRGVRTAQGVATTLAFVMPFGHGEMAFQFLRGADALLGPADVPPEALDGVGALGCGGVALSAPASREATLHALRAAKGAGAATVLDVNYRSFLWPSPAAAADALRQAIPWATTLKCNEAELALLCGTEGSVEARASRLLAATGPQAVVVTLGEHGAAWVGATFACRQPGFAIQAVDAVGAGDCFMGTLLAALAGMPAGPADASAAAALLRRCNAAAALSTSRPGAIDAMPTSAEVDAFLAPTAGG